MRDIGQRQAIGVLAVVAGPRHAGIAVIALQHIGRQGFEVAALVNLVGLIKRAAGNQVTGPAVAEPVVDPAVIGQSVFGSKLNPDAGVLCMKRGQQVLIPNHLIFSTPAFNDQRVGSHGRPQPRPQRDCCKSNCQPPLDPHPLTLLCACEEKIAYTSQR